MSVEQDTDDYPGLVYTGLTGPQGFPNVYFTPADKMNLLTLSMSIHWVEMRQLELGLLEWYLLSMYCSLKPVHPFQRVLKAFPSVVFLVLKTSLGAGGGEEMHDIFSSTIQSQMLLYKPDGLLSCIDFPKSQLEPGPQTPEYQPY